MNGFPDNIKFKFPWRKYQKRVLDELVHHLSDRHLHIIAPPGSGKTVLGLEVVLRLNKPCLIFVPGIALRNQWVARFYELFLQTTETVEWISTDIRRPAFFTVVTYQALHAALSNQKDTETEAEEETDDDESFIEIKKKNRKCKTESTHEIIKNLKAVKIETIVVDEAHHLKNEWWKSLTTVKESLNPVIVGLTATPPFDVSPAEWQRYVALNGTVDAEISVPELILEHNLCPHQDYIIYSTPTAEEHDKIIDFRNRVDRLIDSFVDDNKFIYDFVNHPFLANSIDNIEKIYAKPEYYSAILIFLNHAGIEILPTQKEIVVEKDEPIPALNYAWMEILLTGYLFEDTESVTVTENEKETCFNKLKRVGVIDHRQINLDDNKRVNDMLSTSITKLNSIEQITNFEFECLKENLRMVILTDYIRKEFLSTDTHNHIPLTKVGVISIFEKLRRSNHNAKKIAVLTGSMVIIPTTCSEAFMTEFNKVSTGVVSFRPLTYDADFILVSIDFSAVNQIVNIITNLFTQGYINVLIGTKSLLGEGWDAPAINSLILASFVGSYVTSNQMRGRAIRTQQGNNNKTANIWHLVCTDASLHGGGRDFDLMKRRFKAFVGVNYCNEPMIENGISRLRMPENIFEKDELDKINQQTYDLASQRELLLKRWTDALQKGNVLIEEIKVGDLHEKEIEKQKLIHVKRRHKSVAAAVASVVLMSGQLIYNVFDLAQTVGQTNAFSWLSYVGILLTIWFIRKALINTKEVAAYIDITKDFRNICNALLITLRDTGHIKTPLPEFKITCTNDIHGNMYCNPVCSNTYEKSLYIKSLTEIINPIANPRYIIKRKGKFMNLIHQADYHAVPEILGVNKHSAEVFEKHWRSIVGSCELIFIRSTEGRKVLIKARLASINGVAKQKTDNINRWQ